MNFNFRATVNYPEQTDVETPDFDCRSAEKVAELVKTLIEAEPDATSYLITVVRHRIVQS